MNKRKESYESPKMVLLEILTEQAVLQASELDDYEYGGDPFSN